MLSFHQTILSEKSRENLETSYILLSKDDDFLWEIERSNFHFSKAYIITWKFKIRFTMSSIFIQFKTSFCFKTYQGLQKGLKNLNKHLVG